MRRQIIGILSGILTAAAAPACAAAASASTGGPQYLIETVAGTTGAGDGGPAVAAVLNQPKGIAVDRHGNLYIADTDHHRVRKVTPAGVISTIAGDGRPGMGGDGGPAAEARLHLPFDVAVDAAGNIYIADYGNHRVRRVDAAGRIATVAGTGRKGTNGDYGPAAEAQLSSPRALAVDAAGNLYIAEFEGHRVRKVNTSGIITTAAGRGVAGFAGDGGPAKNAQLWHPAGLAVDASGALFIADSENRRIRRVDPGGVITTWLGGSDPIVLSTPTGLAVDVDGTLWIAQLGHLLYAYSPGGRIDAVNVQDGQDADGIASVALDGQGHVYFLYGGRVRRAVAATGAIETVAGDGYAIALGDHGPAVDALLKAPRGVAVDSAGNLYIADAATHRIRKVSPGGTITTLAGTGAPGHTGDGGPAALAQLRGPQAVAVDPGGGILLADTGNHRIRRVGAGGTIRTVAGSGGTSGRGAEGVPALSMPLHSPAAAVADGRGNLYVADTVADRVLLVDSAGMAFTAAGNGSAGDCCDGGYAPLAQLRAPSALDADAAGNLYIADTLNHRVRMVDAAGLISTVAGTGEPGYSGDGGPGVEARLFEPRGLAVDGDGNLYIADTGNHAVRLLTAGGIIHTIAGTGFPGSDGDLGPAAEAALNTPWSVALDGQGNLYVADSGNRRVRKLSPYEPPAEWVAEAVVVNAASLAPGAVAPGQLVSIFAEGIGPEGGLEIFFDGVPAPVVAAQPGQVSAQVPYEVAGRGIIEAEVRLDGRPHARAAVELAEAAPGIFTAAGGTGPALALNQNGTLNAEANPAPRGSVVTLFATGEGLLDPPGATGATAEAPYGKPLLRVRLAIGGYQAQILYAGAAPGQVGLLQVNARVPAGYVPTGALKVELRIGAAVSQDGVTIMVK